MWNTLVKENFYVFEFFIFIRAGASTLAGIAITLLVQDKICINRYNQTATFCQNINQPMHTDVEQNVKDLILADSTLFGNYKYFMECVPVFIWSLFVGSFLDNYRGGTRLLFTISIVGDTIAVIIYFINVYYFHLSPYYIILASCTYWFTGGPASYMTVTYRYIVMNSTEKFRPLKFMLFQFSIVTGLSLGTYVGGQILQIKSNSASNPFRTYYNNFAVNLAIDVLTFILVFGLSKSNSPFRENELKDSDDESLNEIEEQNQNINKQNFLPILLNIDNVRQTFACFFKPRDGHSRVQIYLLYSILFSQVLIFFGNQDVFFQFTEKVYHWDSKVYSNYASISTIITTVFMTIATVFLVKKWKFEDETLLMIALVSSFCAQLAMGTFLTPKAYIASLFIGSLSGFASITIRNKISRIVPKDELGKIFALSQTIESVMPFLGSLIFSHLFSLTISSFPGLIYQFSALLVLFSIVVAIVERLYCR